ncbi:MAG: hypothetical protein JWQ25_1323 [Daejeonella sp.]|nr:hypothetical protein [Daejeonella sp.]
MENQIVEKRETLDDIDINSDIPGWGVDANAENDPTYPMKKRTNEEHQGYSWVRPPQQPVNIEILHSNERPNVSAVFGTSVPPSGLSGAIRRYAFRYSESEYGHWLPLLLADRINVIEGIVDDLSKGHIPNVFAERGWKAGMKHHPQVIIKKVLVTALVTTVVVAWLFNNSSSKKSKVAKLFK